MRITQSILAAVIFAAFAAPAFAADAPAATPVPAATTAAKTFSDADKAAIEDIVKNYLTRITPKS